MSRGRSTDKKAKTSVTSKSSTSSVRTGLASASQNLFSAPEPPHGSPDSTSKSEPSVTFDPNSIMSYRELMAALAAKKVQITLGNNIIAEDNILINYDVAINFNGYSIISEDYVANARVLDIRSGEVTLTGRGKVFAMGPNGVAIRAFGAISSGVPHYTTLTVDEGISLFAPDAYGILVSPNLGVAYGLTVNFAGQILAHDGVCIASGVNGHDMNLPTINIKSGARITADELSGTALEALGYGVWQVQAAKLYGAIGANLRTGQLEFTHTQIHTSVNSVFAVEDSPTKDLTVAVEGGYYVSEQAPTISGVPTAIKKFTIKDSDVCSAGDIITAELEQYVTDKDCDFTDDVAEFVANLAPQIVATPEPLPSITEPKAAVSVSPTYSEPVKPFHERLQDVPELTDNDTDDQSILLELSAEKVAPAQPIIAPAPTPVAPVKPAPVISTPATPVRIASPAPTPVISEEDAARAALHDAIAEIRKLRPEDYEVGFAELERSLRKAEHLLASPLADLADIRDTASMLLQAFDNLEERDELSLSDDELDELFYHGAVLEEVAHPKKPSKPEKKPKTTSPAPSPKLPAPVPTSAPALSFTPPATPPAAPPEVEPDFSVLSEILTTIAGLKLDNYTPESQETLLDELDRAEAILADMSSSQSEIDEVATSLLAEMSKLERNRFVHSRSVSSVHTSSPVPVIGTVLPATMIDELSPSATWSLGITMIDELAPVILDASARQRMFRAMQPWIAEFFEMTTEPLRKFAKSLSAGIRAGRSAYRNTLQGGRF